MVNLSLGQESTSYQGSMSKVRRGQDMNSSINNYDEAFIQSLWANEECLDLDSVQYGTGEVVLLEAPYLIPDATTGIEIRANGCLSVRDAARLPGVTLSVGLSASAQASVTIEE